jgi:hypothetical protein
MNIFINKEITLIDNKRDNRLPDIAKSELNKDIHPIYDLAFRLVKIYSIDHPHIKNKDTLCYALTNILGILFIRKHTEIFMGHIGKGEYKAHIVITLNGNDYTKPNPEEAKGYNIITFKMTRTNAEQIIKIVETNHICRIKKGNYRGKSTTLILNPLCSWNTSIIENNIVSNLRLYNAYNGEYLSSFWPIKKMSKRAYKPLAYIIFKYNGEKIYKPACKDRIAEVDFINKLWPQDLEEGFIYRRVFNVDEYSGGRFTSRFTSMPKSIRKFLIEDRTDYVEIDFPAMVPNTLRQYVDGEYFSERPYNMVAEAIIKYKYRNKPKLLETAIRLYKEPLSNAIKRPMLYLLNNQISVDNLNSRKYSKSIYKSLINNGLQNTTKEIREAKERFNFITDPEDYNMNVTMALCDMKKRRWSSNVSKDIEAPTFRLSPKNIYYAMTKELKELTYFMLCFSWKMTMRIESELLVQVSKELKKDHLLPLFVHDAFYVPKVFEDKYRNLSYQLLKNIVREFKEKHYLDTNIVNKKEDEFRSILNNFIRKNMENQYIEFNNCFNYTNYKLLKDFTYQVKNKFIHSPQFNEYLKNNDNNLYFINIIKKYDNKLYRLIKENILKIIIENNTPTLNLI